MEIFDQLKEFEENADKNWQRLIYVLRKHMDIWALKNIKPYWGQMKISYMPVIANISVNGSTNSEIVRKSLTVKQAMSRTMKELEEKGMIVSNRRKDDRRSELIELTDVGKQLILDANIEVFKLAETYKELVGEREFEIALSVINKIINYHEQLNITDEENLSD